jgi:hypothetical protein
MEGKEARGFGLSEITLEQSGLGPGQVDNDESIQSLTELAIDIKSDELPAELEVLAKQHRDAWARRLDVSHCVRQIVNIAGVRTYACIAPEWVSGRNEASQVRQPVALLEKRNHQLT